METFCRVLVCVWFVYTFFVSVYIDFEGIKEREPKGFDGFIGTCFFYVVIVLVLYFARLF